MFTHSLDNRKRASAIHQARSALAMLKGALVILEDEDNGALWPRAFTQLRHAKTALGKIQVVAENTGAQCDQADPDLILIDDDPGVAALWELQSGLNIWHFPDLGAFEKRNPPKDIPVFVDLKFEDKPLGFDYSKRIKKLGFESVYLTSGDDYMIDQGDHPYLKGVVDKSFPKHLFEEGVKC